MREQLLIPRYSPEPIEAYSVKAGSNWVGPAYSRMLRSDAEAWNLAWLSHPYELRPEHEDGRFTVIVSHTVNMIRDTGALDTDRRLGPRATLRGLLRLPPNQFWFAINNDLAKRTPMYRIYGDRWLHTVMVRAQAPWRPAWHESGLDISQASDYLKKFTNAHI